MLVGIRWRPSPPPRGQSGFVEQRFCYSEPAAAGVEESSSSYRGLASCWPTALKRASPRPKNRAVRDANKKKARPAGASPLLLRLAGHPLPLPTASKEKKQSGPPTGKKSTYFPPLLRNSAGFFALLSCDTTPNGDIFSLSSQAINTATASTHDAIVSNETEKKRRLYFFWFLETITTGDSRFSY